MTPEILPKFSTFERFADGQMFLCDTTTQKECLDSCLFGSPKSKWHEVRQINENTAIFLYTTGEHPTLHGVFIAVGQPFLDMETSAFDGRFPSQVRVKRFYKFPPIPECNVSKMFKGDRNRQRRLTRRQTHEILAAVISYVYNQSDARILERLSKQRWETTAPPTQPLMMSSGAPIYIYNPKNSKVSFGKRPSLLPSNASDRVLPLLSPMKPQHSPLHPPPLLPLTTKPRKPGFVSRIESRKVVTTGFSIIQGLPPYLYFPVLSQVARPPVKKTTALVTKLFVRNLHKSIKNECLRDCFSLFGKILDSGIHKNAAGLSLGSGWVEFENPTEATRAIEKVNGMLIANLKVIVCPWSDGMV